MAYNEALADRIRESIADQPNVEEKKMMGGLTFMVNDKMCVGILKDDLMIRIDPEIEAQVLEKPAARQMDFTGRPMKGYILVDESGIKTRKDMDYWIGLALDFNSRAKASKKAKKK
jgi:TfoX/Sxy family transcriptional regulator of competence genes